MWGHLTSCWLRKYQERDQVTITQIKYRILSPPGVFIHPSRSSRFVRQGVTSVFKSFSWDAMTKVDRRSHISPFKLFKNYSFATLGIYNILLFFTLSLCSHCTYLFFIHEWIWIKNGSLNITLKVQNIFLLQCVS